jgi:ABC-type glycerol-3-phosphate transport system permease component
MMRIQVNRTKSNDLIFNAVLYLVFTIILFVCLYPFYYIFLISVSNTELTSRQIVTFYPLGFTLKNYVEVFQIKGLYRSFFISTTRTVIGTVFTLFFTSILAYTLSQRELIGRKIFYRIIITSIYLNAGLIPWYLVLRSLHLKDNFLVYILPYAVSVYSMILIKTYIEQVSPSIQESALVDGAGYFTIFIKIILPVSKPVLAAVTVFTAVNQWNLWMDNLLLVSNTNLRTMQLMLLEYLRQAEAIASEIRNSGGSAKGAAYQISPFAVRMTITMVVTIPILLVYPVIQKYFVSGIMLGAVKE